MEKHVASASAFGVNNYYIFGAVAFCKTELPKLGMPLVLYVDNHNADLLPKLLEEEKIDTSNITLIVSGPNTLLQGMLWRVAPYNAEYIHLVDMDATLSEMQLLCIDDFKNSNYDWYTCHLNQHHHNIMGCASGFKREILETVHPIMTQLGVQCKFRYCFDESALNKVVPVVNSNGILYTTCDSYCNFTVPTVKHIENSGDFDDHTATLSRFEVLDNYDNGAYMLGGRKIIIDFKPKWR